MRIGASLLRYFGIILGWQKPFTQTTCRERALLCKYLPGKQCIVEIGVFEGFTTRVLTENACPDGIVYGVDPFFKGRLGISWGYKISQFYNADALRSGRLKFVPTLSTNVGDLIPANVDFVFVDADHSLEGIMADWAFWSERVVQGGIIALHDSLVPAHNPRVANFGSHKYFESHIKNDQRFEVLDTVDSVAVLRRR